MSRVARLPDTVINQIAAGEVVERPASVVKELLENALDAEATRVVVDITQGGLDRIRITDDGIGMSREDAELALERHATSKLRVLEDLDSLATLGFRGEALPSIASVSRFTLTTTERGALEGTQLVIEGGRLDRVGAVGAPPGTTMDVRDLFFNVPARRKFMKRPETESSHVHDVVVRLALARPHVSIKLIHNGRVVLDVPAATDDDPQGRLGRIFGHEVSAHLYPVVALEGPVRVSGWCAAPELSERTTRGLYTFVNGRFVRDRTVQHAAQEGYRTLLERGRYPVVVLAIEVDPAEVDVNVHPQKTEVRFAQASDVHRAITQALTRTLAEQPWLGPRRGGAQAVLDEARERGGGDGARAVLAEARAGGGWREGLGILASLTGAPLRDGPPDDAPGYGAALAGGGQARVSHDQGRYAPGGGGSFAEGAGFGGAGFGGEAFGGPGFGGTGFDRASDTGGLADPGRGRGGRGPARSEPRVTGSTTAPLFPRALWPEPLAAGPRAGGGVQEAPSRGLRFGALEPVGQIHATYLVCEGEGGLVLIDQHAAHERIAFERMRCQRMAGGVEAQPLLVPLTLPLDEARAATARDHQAELLTLGFELEPFGGQTWAVKTVPTALGGADVARVLLDVLDELRELDRGRTPVDDALAAALSCAACHTVVRAGDRLSKDEIRALLVQMDEIDFGAHCPHGRPVFVEWSARQLAAMFHRT